MAAMGLGSAALDRRSVLYVDSTESAKGFREDRGRHRRRMRAILLVGSLCVIGLVHVYLATEVASRRSRLTGLRERYKILSTDLTVAQSKLDQRRMYGALLVPAERAGFASAVERHTVQVEAPVAAPAPSDLEQFGAEVRRSTDLVTAAFAEGKRDGRRAHPHGARP
jgi:hypothetical protein